MITPTIGRHVDYWPRGAKIDDFVYIPFDPDQRALTQALPCAAVITYVWDERCVNLAVFDHNGNSHSLLSVRLVQPEDAIPESGPYCRWMPYQVSQGGRPSH